MMKRKASVVNRRSVGYGYLDEQERNPDDDRVDSGEKIGKPKHGEPREEYQKTLV
jgi:hypothetical protein